MRRFFIDPSETASMSFITGTDAKHIKNVLRMKPGDKILLFDGLGTEYESSIISLSPGSVEVSIIRKLKPITSPFARIIIAQALLKDRKMDGLVRQLTELGMAKWMPFISERSVSRPDMGRLAARRERWKKIAKEALKQCRRSTLPEIELPVSFEDILDVGKSSDLRVVFWENETFNFGVQSCGNRYHTIIAMLGPEGGFTCREIEAARDCGFITASLGPRILRSETAAISACTLLQYFFGDMGKKNS
ncbi:RsmE family RNA methyltransferase [Desulfococcaceae bacterium HSG8]|nr:RsmE family RNA methyltransferase [Desulfococcaceae bacterium HSG8]